MNLFNQTNYFHTKTTEQVYRMQCSHKSCHWQQTYEVLNLVQHFIHCYSALICILYNDAHYSNKIALCSSVCIVQ